MRMPEYTPVYVVTGFLDSGKTSLLNQLLSRRLESGHSLCCIQFEQGEQALEQDLIDRGNLDLLHFPVRKLQSGAGMQQVSKQIYDYLLRNDPEELWIEWNGTLPISVLQTLFPPAKKQDGGTPGDFCQLQRMLYLADSTKLDALLQQTGGMALEQISASDVIVLRNWGPVSQFKNRKRMLRELNPGVKVLPLNSVGTVERAMLRPGRQPAFWFLLGIAYFTAAYLTLRMVIGAGGNLADAVVNVFLGILLQAFPFLLIGVLLSSAIQIFVSQQWLHEHFPKHLAGGLLFAALAGFCLPVCDCASVPVFRSLVRKGVPPAAAVTFLMAAPVINPVVILSTWYAFSGDVRIVLCRVGLGLLCAVLIGLTFSRAGKNGLSSSGSGWFSCACGCSVGQAAEGGKLSLYLRHTQTEFFSVGKYLVLGALVSALFQTLDRSFPWGNGGDGLFLPLLVLMGMAFFLSLCSSADAVVARSFAGQFPMGALMGFMVFGPMMDIKNLILLSGGFSRKFVLRLCLTSFCICGMVVFLSFSTGLERSLL